MSKSVSCASSVSLFSFWKAQRRVLIGTGRRWRVPWASVVVIGFFFCFCFFCLWCKGNEWNVVYWGSQAPKRNQLSGRKDDLGPRRWILKFHITKVKWKAKFFNFKIYKLLKTKPSEQGIKKSWTSIGVGWGGMLVFMEKYPLIPILTVIFFLSSFSAVFWLGDLNYRISEMDSDLVRRLADTGKYDELLENDQLIKQRSERKCFRGFKEGEIKFKPTYKYDPGTDNWDTRWIWHNLSVYRAHVVWIKYIFIPVRSFYWRSFYWYFG